MSHMSAWNELFDFGTACRREAREQNDRRGLEARRRVAQDVGGGSRGVEVERDGSSVDFWNWWREAMHREDSEQEFQAPAHASYWGSLISSVWQPAPFDCRTARRLAELQVARCVRYMCSFSNTCKLDQSCNSSGRSSTENTQLANKDTSLSVKIGIRQHRTPYTSRAQQGIAFRVPRAASHAIRGEGAAGSKQ